MKALLSVLFLLCLANPSFAAEWTNLNTGLQTTYTMLHVVDWLQTLEFSQRVPSVSHYATQQGNSTIWITHVEKPRTESNFILGSRPSRDKVNIYFASTLVAHAVVSYVLPRGWREAWQGAGIVVEAYCVGNNWNAGVKGIF